AALDTRRSKDPADQVDDPALRTHRARDYGVAPTDAPQLAEWRERAQRLGLGEAELDAVTGRGLPLTPLEREALQGRIAAELVGPEGLTAQASSFTRRDVLRAWCDRLPQGTTVAEVERLADATLASTAVRKLTDLPRPASPRHCDVIRRADGRTVRVPADQQRYSTVELLAAEAAVIDSARSRANGTAGQVRSAPLEAALAARATLGADQVEMVRRLTSSGAGVELVVGRPGTGKTYAIGAAAMAWEADGFTVKGAALAAQAAQQLADGAGIDSHTVDSLLADLDRGGRLAPRSVLVVDEAGMVGTRKLARLFRHAEIAGAKLVLIGDHHQPPEIDAGGVFRGLQSRLAGTTELTENRRQVAAWERDALDSYRAGRPADALAAYEARDRLTISADASQRRTAMVDDWWQARTRGEDTLMLAARRADVDALNTAARQRRIDAGELGATVATVATTPYAVGDEVMTLRNRHQLGIRNGTRATVLAAQDGGLRVRTSEGAKVILPDWYLKAGWVTHAYATTVHKGQGATCDRALLLANDALFREAGYVGLSRARHHTQLYLVSAPEPLDLEGNTRRRSARHDPVNEIARALAGSRAKRLAHDTVGHNRRPSPAPTPHREARSPRHGAPVAPDSRRRPPEAAIETPRYLRVALGERPDGTERQAVWDDAADAIAAYRARYDVGDPTSALGPIPRDHGQRAARAETQVALQTARNLLGHSQSHGLSL
ncbi:MAG: AAA family ATPase, partial [Actinomycetota bacterium]|nr:AAA family ATPase [Actinomycetota bacterium]